jgi:hypothetical protein
MAYADEVLADSPLAYWRMEETTLDPSPVMLADASGNGRDLPFHYLDFSGGYNPLGYATGIESDVGGSSVHVAFPPDAISDIEDWSRGVITHAPWFHLLNDFTLECWYNGGTWDNSYGVNLRTIFGTSDFFIGMLLRTSGDPRWRFAAFVTLSDESSYTVKAENIPPEDDTFYHVVAVRVLNSLNVYVNAQLYASAILPNLPQKNSGGSFYVGPRGTTTALAGEIDEAAIYDYALPLDRIRAHYEAGLNSLALRGRIQLRQSYSLDAADATPPADWIFRHNWDRPVREELEYGGRTIRGANGNEQAYALDVAPRRKVTFEAPTNTAEATAKLNSLLWYSGTQHPYVRVPLWHYKTRLGAPLSSGATSIPLTTQYLDFDAGARVMICTFGDSFDVEAYETAEIESVEADELTLSTATQNDWPATAWVVPMRRCAISKPIRHTLHTSRAASRVIDCRVIPADNPDARNRVTEWTPAATFEGVELFNPFTWRRTDEPRPELEHARVEDVIDFGSGLWSVSQPQDAPEEVLPIRYVIEGNANISAFLGFLDYRQGTTRALWLPTARHDFTKVSQSGANLTIQSINYTRNYALHEARTAIAFISSDGQTIAARRIADAVDNGNGTETLTLSSSVPAANSYSCICWLWLARLDQNVVAIDWITQCAIQVELRFRNILSSE